MIIIIMMLGSKVWETLQQIVHTDQQQFFLNDHYSRVVETISNFTTQSTVPVTQTIKILLSHLWRMFINHLNYSPCRGPIRDDRSRPRPHQLMVQTSHRQKLALMFISSAILLSIFLAFFCFFISFEIFFYILPFKL